MTASKSKRCEMQLRSMSARINRTCHSCKSYFVTVKDLEIHRTRFHKTPIYCCCFCPIEFHQKNDILDHLENHHLRLRFFLRTKRMRTSLKSFVEKVELFNRNLGARIVEERDGVGEFRLHMRCLPNSRLLPPTQDESAAFGLTLLASPSEMLPPTPPSPQAPTAHSSQKSSTVGEAKSFHGEENNEDDDATIVYDYREYIDFTELVKYTPMSDSQSSTSRQEMSSKQIEK